VFVPIAENSGLIVPLTEFVITKACELLSVWQSAGVTAPIAINISAVHFRQVGELQRSLRTPIQTYGIDPGLLRLELTETALMNNSDIATDTLRELVAMGIQVALDDFGTGYSSLSALQLYPLHMLKIDRSFMHELAASKKNTAIIHGLINLAEGLGLEVLAEGVETLEQYRVLSDCGCHSFQGSLMNPALSAEECTRLLTASGQSFTSLIVGNSPDLHCPAD
jgi:EAL domain-containing protein (putative c-di-GMP-specific phosphodiesterase class I)